MPQRNLREQLVEGATQVLYEHGYHAASVNDIVAAAGVPKGSFYNHFDSKEALALEVTRRYSASVDLDSLRAGDAAPLARVRAHFASVIERNAAHGVQHGCLLGNFSTELAGHSPAICQHVSAAFDEWSGAVADALSQAQDAGDLDPSFDPSALGAYLVDAYEGAVARAKVTRDRAPLDAFLTTTFDVLLAR
jgi:TetR/AcrR family transcriptional repressor of nem operon